MKSYFLLFQNYFISLNFFSSIFNFTAHLSIESFPSSCARVATSRRTTELVANQFMEQSSPTRISSWSTPALELYRWQTRAATQTAASSSYARQSKKEILISKDLIRFLLVYSQSCLINYFPQNRLVGWQTRCLRKSHCGSGGCQEDGEMRYQKWDSNAESNNLLMWRTEIILSEDSFTIKQQNYFLKLACRVAWVSLFQVHFSQKDP